MIMYSFGRYLTQTVHDHGSHPKCLNLKLGHKRIERAASRGRAAAVVPSSITEWPAHWARTNGDRGRYGAEQRTGSL
jgi:hypothetical protein